MPGADAAAVGGRGARGRIIGESANFARGLANEPGNVLTPASSLARVAQAASAVGLASTSSTRIAMRELGMGLLLAVAQGSAEPPRLMVMRHEPARRPEGPVLALVGKGVTFDTGGISIKPADAMDRMKDDMAGGAAVVGRDVGDRGAQGAVRVIGLVPTVENMVGGRASRPGDVITGASGKTVEISIPMRKGRLILADALWYAQQLGATHLVDVATLTGTVMVGLGRTVAGLYRQPGRVGR